MPPTVSKPDPLTDDELDMHTSPIPEPSSYKANEVGEEAGSSLPSSPSSSSSSSSDESEVPSMSVPDPQCCFNLRTAEQFFTGLSSPEPAENKLALLSIRKWLDEVRPVDATNPAYALHLDNEPTSKFHQRVDILIHSNTFCKSMESSLLSEDAELVTLAAQLLYYCFMVRAQADGCVFVSIRIISRLSSLAGNIHHPAFCHAVDALVSLGINSSIYIEKICNTGAGDTASKILNENGASLPSDIKVRLEWLVVMMALVPYLAHGWELFLLQAEEICIANLMTQDCSDDVTIAGIVGLNLLHAQGKVTTFKNIKVVKRLLELVDNCNCRLYALRAIGTIIELGPNSAQDIIAASGYLDKLIESVDDHIGQAALCHLVTKNHDIREKMADSPIDYISLLLARIRDGSVPFHLRLYSLDMLLALLSHSRPLLTDAQIQQLASTLIKLLNTLPEGDEWESMQFLPVKAAVVLFASQEYDGRVLQCIPDFDFPNEIICRFLRAATRTKDCQAELGTATKILHHALQHDSTKAVENELKKTGGLADQVLNVILNRCPDIASDAIGILDHLLQNDVVLLTDYQYSIMTYVLRIYLDRDDNDLIGVLGCVNIISNSINYLHPDTVREMVYGITGTTLNVSHSGKTASLGRIISSIMQTLPHDDEAVSHAKGKIERMVSSGNYTDRLRGAEIIRCIATSPLVDQPFPRHNPWLAKIALERIGTETDQAVIYELYKTLTKLIASNKAAYDMLTTSTVIKTHVLPTAFGDTTPVLLAKAAFTLLCQVVGNPHAPLLPPDLIDAIADETCRIIQIHGSVFKRYSMFLSIILHCVCIVAPSQKARVNSIIALVHERLSLMENPIDSVPDLLLLSQNILRADDIPLLHKLMFHSNTVVAMLATTAVGKPCDSPFVSSEMLKHQQPSASEISSILTTDRAVLTSIPLISYILDQFEYDKKTSQKLQSQPDTLEVNRLKSAFADWIQHPDIWNVLIDIGLTSEAQFGGLFDNLSDIDGFFKWLTADLTMRITNEPNNSCSIFGRIDALFTEASYHQFMISGGTEVIMSIIQHGNNKLQFSIDHFPGSMSKYFNCTVSPYLIRAGIIGAIEQNFSQPGLMEQVLSSNFIQLLLMWNSNDGPNEAEPSPVSKQLHKLLCSFSQKPSENTSMNKVSDECLYRIITWPLPLPDTPQNDGGSPPLQWPNEVVESALERVEKNFKSSYMPLKMKAAQIMNQLLLGSVAAIHRAIFTKMPLDELAHLVAQTVQLSTIPKCLHLLSDPLSVELLAKFSPDVFVNAAKAVCHAVNNPHLVTMESFQYIKNFIIGMSPTASGYSRMSSAGVFDRLLELRDDLTSLHAYQVMLIFTVAIGYPATIGYLGSSIFRNLPGFASLFKCLLAMDSSEARNSLLELINGFLRVLAHTYTDNDTGYELLREQGILDTCLKYICNMRSHEGSQASRIINSIYLNEVPSLPGPVSYSSILRRLDMIQFRGHTMRDYVELIQFMYSHMKSRRLDPTESQRRVNEFEDLGGASEIKKVMKTKHTTREESKLLASLISELSIGSSIDATLTSLAPPDCEDSTRDLYYGDEPVPLIE
ncbi:hypothetical protein GQ42DRAFT_179052 [Ramicandelaber brevisporus]|nr:hypothetical protein GQ42DRAFT_179052 [Ramicandelaber brevisporus]